MGDDLIPRNDLFELGKSFTEAQMNNFLQQVKNSPIPVSLDIPKPHIYTEAIRNPTEELMKIRKELEISNQKNDELRKQNEELQKAVKSLRPNDKKQFWLGVLGGVLGAILSGLILSAIL